MTTAEKVAYLRGLAEGFGIGTEGKEGKILTTIADILEDLALDQEDLNNSVTELAEGLDAVSEDLEDVEDVLFGDDEEDHEDPEDEEDGEAEVDSWDGKTVYYECRCPVCGETVTFDEDVLAQGGIQCPACGEQLEFDLEEEPDPETSEEQSET